MQPSRVTYWVLGGGITGLSIARELAARGVEVTLLETRRLGAGATGSSAGILPHITGGRSPLARLNHAAFEGYEGFIRKLEDESGCAVRFRRPGELEIPVDALEAKKLRSRLERAGEAAEWLEADELRRRIPGIAGSLTLTGAALFPRAAWVHPGDLVAALGAHLDKLRVSIREDQGNIELECSGKRVEAVVAGERLALKESDQLFICAGAWSPLVLGDVKPSLPVQPIRGQMVEVESKVEIETIIHRGPSMIVPTEPGRLWLGSTVEEAGYDEQTTPEGIAEVIEQATSILPDLEDAKVLRTWAGLRPQALRRGGPFIGHHPALKNLWICAGHYRSGLLNAPLGARELVKTALGEPTDIDLEPFRVDR